MINTEFPIKKQIFINDTEWNIYNTSIEQSHEYFKNYNLNILQNLNIHLHNLKNIENLNTIKWSNSIIYDAIINNNTKFYNIFNGECHNVYNVSFSYKDAPVIFFWCNPLQPYFIIQLSSYMDFFYIGDYNEKKIIEISHSTAGHEYYLGTVMNHLDFIKTNHININAIEHLYFDKKYLYFGFNSNIGHHLWNEISGLYYFLNNKHLHKKIKSIIIGEYDFFNMKRILSKYKFKIIDFENQFGKLNECSNIFLNHYPCFLNHYYIDNKIQSLFDFKQNIQTHDIEITFNIRTNRRILTNNSNIIEQTIIDLTKEYMNYSFKFNFCGVFETNCFKIDKETNEEYLIQTEIITTLINNLNNNFKNNTITQQISFNNMIGYDINYIFNNTKNSIICLAIIGTSVSNLLNWIIKNYIIVYGPKDAYQWTQIQYDVLENDKCDYLPIEYILESDGLQNNFTIDYLKYFEFIKTKINNYLLEL